jgi:hypothetical protein
MMLITKDLMRQLQANAAATLAAQANGTAEPDHKPVVKFFTPDGAATWLIAEIADDGDTLYGLCDLGMGEPELGYVSLAELQALRGGYGLPVERDKWFRTDKTIREYAAIASANRGIRA